MKFCLLKDFSIHIGWTSFLLSNFVRATRISLGALEIDGALTYWYHLYFLLGSLCFLGLVSVSVLFSPSASLDDI